MESLKSSIKKRLELKASILQENISKKMNEIENLCSEYDSVINSLKKMGLSEDIKIGNEKLVKNLLKDQPTSFNDFNTAEELMKGVDAGITKHAIEEKEKKEVLYQDRNTDPATFLNNDAIWERMDKARSARPESEIKT